MLRKRTSLTGAATTAALLVTVLCAGCGGSASQNLEVIVLDRSESFCELNSDCKVKVARHIEDRLEHLAKRGGALRLLLIGNDNGAAVQALSNDECKGYLRGAAACFEKPTLWNKIFGRSGTQLKAARANLIERISQELSNTREITGSSIIDALMAAERYLNDRRLHPGDRQLVVLSDMIEESKTDIPPFTCAHVGQPEQNRQVLEILQGQGRLPDLEFTYVEVIGVNAPDPLNAACRARFWAAYFDRAGADLGFYGGM